MRRLRRLDTRRIPEGGPPETRLFTKVRNEGRRLPFFLEHHRRLGVERFFVVDNGSSDDTVPLALDQPDVHLFATEEPLLRHGFWIEGLLHQFGTGRWCIVADADELLVLPSLGELSLRGFTRYMEQAGANALSALLLDLYPKASLPPGTYEAGDDPRRHCDHFDPEFTSEVTKRFNPRHQRWFETRRFGGGTRQRVFGVEVNLTKFPLFLHGPELWLSPGAHALDGARIAEERAVMLHTKYLDDFIQRTTEGARRGVYSDGGGYYSSIAAQLVSSGSRTPGLWWEGAHRLEQTSDLRDTGVLQSSTRLDAFVRDHRE